MKKILLTFLLIISLVLSLASCGAPGEPGAKGDKGEKGDTGEAGVSPTVTINEDGFWVINGVATEVKAVGEDGESVTITSCVKTGTSDNGYTDIYTLHFSNGTSTTFEVEMKPTPVVKMIKATSTVGDDTIFTIFFEDGTSYTIAVSAAKDGEPTEIRTAYDTAIAGGFVGTYDEFVISSINTVIDMFGPKNSIFSVEELITVALPEMLANYNTYLHTTAVPGESSTVEIEANEGYYTAWGDKKAHGSRYYSQNISVKAGDLVVLMSDMKACTMLFATAFTADGTCVGDFSGVDCTSFLTAAGVDYIIISYDRSLEAPYAKISGTTYTTAIKETVTSTTISKLITELGGNNGSGSGLGNTSGIIVSAALGSSSISTKVETLAAGAEIQLEENHIMNHKQLTFSARFKDFGSNVIELGHGKENEGYGTSWIEITGTHVSAYNYYSKLTPIFENKAHGLTFTDYINVAIDVDTSVTTLTISTASGVFQTTINGWSGAYGKIFASTESELTDVKMRWNCSDYNKSIWMFGDSYFSRSSEARWTTHLYKNGYDDFLLSGYPGRNTEAALKDFKTALTHGTPQYVVWCMGMNDNDTSSAANAKWLAATSEFLKICNEKGITPILTTTPCVPDRINSFKNEWIRNSGYRYVDFAMAVGAEKDGSGWYDGMLNGDRVHPDKPGALALYAQFIADFPEIMRND